jgi:hypothetical protein
VDKTVEENMDKTLEETEEETLEAAPAEEAVYSGTQPDSEGEDETK